VSATAEGVRPCKLPSPHGFLQTLEVRPEAKLGGQGKQGARVAYQRASMGVPSSRTRLVATRRTTTETTRRTTGGARTTTMPRAAARRSAQSGKMQVQVYEAYYY
jgi:hypothetical protein